MIAYRDLLPAVKAKGDHVVGFLQRLVQVPSRTGNEEQVAALVARELRTLGIDSRVDAVSYTHLRAHETVLDLVCRLLLEKKNKQNRK